MMERAGMSEMDIYHRTRDIFLYFKLQYDTEQPVGCASSLTYCLADPYAVN